MAKVSALLILLTYLFMPKQIRPLVLRSRSATLALPEMPDRTILVLTWTASTLFALYLMFVIITVVFATMQTTLAVKVQETQSSISSLESTYYADLARENSMTPAQIGLVQPSEVKYATERPTAVSFAGN